MELEEKIASIEKFFKVSIEEKQIDIPHMLIDIIPEPQKTYINELIKLQYNIQIIIE